MNESRRSISRKKFLQMSGLSALSLFSLSSTQNSDELWNPVLGFADAAGRPRRPLWVRQADEPTIRVNWDQIKRFDARDAVLGDGENLADFIGEKQAAAALERTAALRQERSMPRLRMFITTAACWDRKCRPRSSAACLLSRVQKMKLHEPSGLPCGCSERPRLALLNSTNEHEN